MTLFFSVWILGYISLLKLINHAILVTVHRNKMAEPPSYRHILHTITADWGNHFVFITKLIVSVTIGIA